MVTLEELQRSKAQVETKMLTKLKFLFAKKTQKEYFASTL